MNCENSNKIQIGATYRQAGAQLHLIALREGTALIEYISNGKVIQYVVTTGLYIAISGDLCWRGSGSYFPFGYGEYKTANDALNAAWLCFRSEEHVYLLTADASEGMWAAVFQTRSLALTALQTVLDQNAFMQEIAEENGLIPLTAEHYLQMQYVFTERTEDHYAIDGMSVLKSVPRKGIGGDQCTSIGL